MDEPKIKPQLKLFVLNYLGKCEGNAVKSAIEAGYSKNYAKSQAHKLLRREDVKAYMTYAQSNKTDLATYDLEQLRRFWVEIMSNKNQQTKDRLRASELLGKSIGAFESEW